MNLQIQEEYEVDSSWNTDLLKSPLGNIYHTKEYANYVRSTKGWNTSFIRMFTNSGKLVAQNLLVYYPRGQNKGKIKKFITTMPGIRKNIYRWIYGPILIENELGNDIHKEFLRFLIKKKGMVLGSCHPLDNSLKNFNNLSLKMSSWGTFLIDLTQGKESLWSQLRADAKRRVNYAKKNNIKVKKMREGDLQKYHELLKETKSKVGWDIKLEEVSALWKNLKPVGFSGFIATLDEIPLGGTLVSSFNNYINEWGVARSKEEAIKKANSGDLIRWEIIEWGISNKAQYYDLTGVNPHPENPKEKGIFENKSKWGGKLVEYLILSN